IASDSVAKATMNFYIFLSQLGYLKSYKSKIMIVAFVGLHVPLIALLIYAATLYDSPAAAISHNPFMLIVIGVSATLLGTGFTLWALSEILTPITATADAVRDYRRTQKLPTLPTQYTDDAGELMANTTHTIQKLHNFIRYIENYDNLTGLPNRKVFESQLKKIVDGLSPQQQVTVFLVDIDGFKGLNTLAGNHVGDRILQAIAQRLSKATNQAILVARIGNDEFALLYKEYKAENDTDYQGTVTARSLLAHLSEHYDNIPKDLNISVSIGIASHTANNIDTEQLIANAYTALQQAKQKGHNSYHVYCGKLTKSLQKRSKLANDLRRALPENQLFLHYQPRIDWRTRTIVGVECLVRWQHPELGVISPVEFIPIAEETGLILPIGQWILQQACQQNKAWQTENLPKFTVAVNLSARQIEQAGLSQMVQQTLEATELEPKFLELEVTESLLKGDTDQISDVLEKLHSQGIALALDDFGTGYSSLSYLRKFPFDILKIDQSFVRDIVQSSEAEEVTRAIVSLAKGLRLGLIAEGVETKEQLNKIKTYGCHEIQGYYFSRPLSPNQLVDFVRSIAREPMAA
ncbi:MAG: bifunctional diguanylate cyclase/phosphodiesterase, partial [Cyanobacteria bacterium J06632_3]